ncbi:MAG: Undecaprenyl-phosphate N-acetylglucosaminyl 1-phosphate transferase [Myxococcaceae bacterium]|nr:Undecaprenyl-phosphate N-acetylglucosaminyl 1-phosphate transferase [Myxococcaceae bacterium]
MNAVDEPDESLPLPHGTDVVTRVPRTVDGDEISAGTVGRVVGSQGEALDLQILGVGVVRYLRREVAPFRTGQLRYALAREAAWGSLHRNVVLEAVVGSQAWGLAEEHSDTDRRGLFVLPFSWTTRLGDTPADLVSADGSSTYWEVAKVVNNALRADPNTLELLFVANVRATDLMGEWILAERDAFLSSRIHASFGQYALSQLKKLKRSLRLAEHRDLVLDWLRVDPRLSLDQAAVRLVERARIVAPSPEAATLQAKEYLKQLYGSLCDQGLLPAKSFEALAVYARESPDLSALPRRLGPKNAYNLLRLLITATGWLRTGSPEFELQGAVRDDLMAIKRGEVALEEILARAEGLSRELDEAHRTTQLPERPDLARAQALLIRVREEAARRWLAATNDPFGRGSASIPLPEWKI